MILVLFFASMFLLSVNVQAKTCSPQEVREYINQANKIVYNVDLVVTETEKYMEASLFNLTNEMMLINTDDSTERYYAPGSQLKIKEYDINYVHRKSYEIYLADRQCSNSPLRKIEIFIPKYNVKFDNDFCKENPRDKCCVKLLYSNDEVKCEEVSSTSSSEIVSSKPIQKDIDKIPIEYILMGLGIVMVIILIIVIIIKYKENNKMKERGII